MKFFAVQINLQKKNFVVNKNELKKKNEYINFTKTSIK